VAQFRARVQCQSLIRIGAAMMTGTALVSGQDRKQQQQQRKRSKSSSFCDVVDAADDAAAAASADECGGDGLLLRRTRSCMRQISAKRLDIRHEIEQI
jgi:hypothetical protein